MSYPPDMSGLKVAFVNFWPGFTPETGLLRLLLDTALGGYGVVARPEDADIILTSTFGSAPQSARFPERAIAVIWENYRPGYTAYAYSFSSDFDTHATAGCPSGSPNLIGQTSFRRHRLLQPTIPPWKSWSKSTC